VVNALAATKHFEWLTKAEDENEHSLEMQMPYIKKVLGGQNFTLVPIMVGRVSLEQQELYDRSCMSPPLSASNYRCSYAKLLLPYFEQPGTVFVISSDFCHWGERFSFTCEINTMESSQQIH
jgi:predicted class III extradiol MEMO1 family dioxygenase